MEPALRVGNVKMGPMDAHPDHAGAHGPPDWPIAAGLRAPDDPETGTSLRTLNDGSQWTIVKRVWHPRQLEATLSELGWKAEVSETSFAFMYGSAKRK